MQEYNSAGTGKRLNSFDSRKTKLHFSDGDEDSVLVFEHDSAAKKKEQSKNGSNEPPVQKKELSVPEKYSIDERHNTSRIIENEEPKIRPTYMPKFTSASLNYKVTEEIRPRRRPDPKVIAQKYTQGASGEPKEIIDPTGEVLESESVTDAKVIDVSAPTPQKEEFHSTIYKFEEPKKEEAKPSFYTEAESSADEESEISADEPKYVFISDEPSADLVFGDGEINYAAFQGANDRSERITQENEIKSEISGDENDSQIAPEPETCAEEEKDEQGGFAADSREYKLPDPENIVIDVPSPGDASIIQKSESLRAVDAPKTVGDDLADEDAIASIEFESYSQRSSVKDKFLDSIMADRIRLIASCVLLVFAFCFENMFYFGVGKSMFPNLFEFRFSAVLIDAFVVICLFVLAMPEVISAFRRLLFGRATPELFLPVTFVVIILYSSALIIYSPKVYPLFALVFALISCNSILAGLLKKSAIFSGFKTISAKTEKKVVDRKLTRNLEAESFAVDGKVENYKSKTAIVHRAAFVLDFFKRSGKGKENSNGFLLILATAFGFAFVGGAIAFFIPGGLMSAITTFVSVFMLGIPSFAILTHKISFYDSSVEAMRENSVIVGEDSLYDYSGVDVLTFKDTDVFGVDDLNLQRIMLYGKNENLTKASRQMAALFAAVGGPLEKIFVNSVDNHFLYAINVSVEDGGVIGEISGKTVCAGTYEFMKRKSVKFPEEPQKDNSFSSTRVMYAAEEGEVYAKFYIRYSLSEDFTVLLQTLSDEGIVPLVYTRDPNISNELFKMLTAGSDTVRVLKKYNVFSDDDRLYHKVSVGLVTTGDNINIVNMLILAKKYVRFQAKMNVTEITAAIIGCVLAIFISMGKLSAYASLAFSAWQIAWCIALFIMSRRTLKTRRRRRRFKE